MVKIVLLLRQTCLQILLINNSSVNNHKEEKRQSQRPFIGVGVLIWKGQQLLLGNRMSTGQSSCWQFPGGHLEADESVCECAKREALEETGLTVTGLRHLGFTDRSFIDNGRSYITLLVSSEYSAGELQVVEPDKCECWQWFDYRQLPEPLFQPIMLFMAQQKNLLVLHQQSPVIASQ